MQTDNTNQFLTFEGIYLSVSIETPHYLQDYVEYPVRVTYSVNESLAGECYTVVKRYSDFDTLKQLLKGSQVPYKLPPKKLFGKFDMTLVNERKVLLEKFLKSIIQVPVIGKSVPITNFLQKNLGAVIDYSKHSVQQVSLDFRCETNWQIGRIITEMGCRIKKAYIMASSMNDQNRYILSWSEYGPEYLSINSKNCQKVLKSLVLLKHEFIYPITYVMVSDSGVSIIRPLTELGSLHDYMRKVKACNSVINKYGLLETNTTLLNQISLFGRQILIGLKYLHEKGIPYGHLHLRNVLLINEQKCGLTDIENCTLGLIPQYRHFYVGILKKLTFEEIDIYCFGRIIYEMSFGEELPTTFIENDDQLSWPTPSIREFLFSVLTEGVLRNGFPTIDSMLELSIFKSYSNRPVDKAPFKISPALKEFLESIHRYSLSLLTKDQKMVKSQRRKVEADAIGSKIRQKRQENARKVKTIDAGDDYDPKPANRAESNVTGPGFVTLSGAVQSPPISPPPAPVPPPPAPPPSQQLPSKPASTVHSDDPSRGELLNAICGFSKSHLRKAKTNDRSCPKV